jgi:hypothetical protein
MYCSVQYSQNSCYFSTLQQKETILFHKIILFSCYFQTKDHHIGGGDSNSFGGGFTGMPVNSGGGDDEESWD